MSFNGRVVDAPAGQRARDVPAIRDAFTTAWNQPMGLWQQSILLSKGQDPVNYAAWETRTLTVGAMVWVADSMVDLVDSIRVSVPDDITVAEADPLFPAGLVVFQHPILGVPSDDVAPTIAVNAVLWGPVNVPDGEAIGISSYQLETVEGVRVWVPIGRSDWLLAEKAGEVVRSDAAAVWPTSFDRFAASAVDDRRTLTAIWQAARLDRHVDRHTWEPHGKKARKQAHRRPDRVEVLRLRQYDQHGAPDPGGANGDGRYSHRWYVRPHWRWQPYGPGRSLRRLTMVAGHIKGPEDAPLLPPKSRVHVLD